MFNLYRNIQQIAEKHGYTVSKMCDEIGISRAVMSNLKNGRAETISMRNLKKIADFLNEPLDLVMHGGDEPEQKRIALTDLREGKLSEEELMFVDLLRQMTAEQRGRQLANIRDIVGASRETKK